VLFYIKKRFLRAFPTAEKRGKKPPADEKAGGCCCLSGSRPSLRTPQPLGGLRRKAKIGRACIGQFSAPLPLSFQYVSENAPAFSKPDSFGYSFGVLIELNCYWLNVCFLRRVY
jgi:hypothetical protein